jgi:glucose dehydrogenase
LVFFGEGNGTIRALDGKTGKLLWHYNCDAGANGVPMSYEVNGKQYVAIGCGGSTLHNFKRGNKFYVFTL